MSTIADFNRIEDCDKIDAKCIDAYAEIKLNELDPLKLELNTSWGDSEIDLTTPVKSGETLTTLYLSPSNSPNCLVYEPERGDNICINGDNLSNIISMQKLKDVNRASTISNGDVYMYDGATQKFNPYNLNTVIGNFTSYIAELQARITTLEQTVASQEGRIQVLEALLVKPTGSPNDARVAWSNINLYSDPNATIDSSGNVTSLDKTHGIYSHNTNTNAYGDEIMG